MPILRWPMMKKATVQKLISTVTKSRPLKMQAYLRLDYSTRRNQVISWEAVPKEKVPKAALAKLNR